MSEEISQTEVMMLLVVIVSLLVVAVIGGVGAFAFFRYWWRSRCESRVLQHIAQADDAAALEKVCSGIGKSTSPLLQSLVKLRIRQLAFEKASDEILGSTSTIRFDGEELSLEGLPADQHGDAMTFMEVLSTLETLQLQGETLKADLAKIELPSQWARVISTKQLRYGVTLRVETLKNRRSDVQTIEESVVHALETRHLDGNPIPKQKLLTLVAALRQIQHEDVDSKGLRLVSPSKDEFGFLLESFESLSRQHRVQADIHAVCTELKSTASSDSSATGSDEEENEVMNGEAVPPKLRKVSAVAQRLETVVQQAENLELSHLEEVKQAQYMLEEAHRDTFALMSTRDSVKSVDVLANKLVDMGVEHQSAVLKAASICANQSNMVLLTGTLRNAFDEFRRTEMIKMEQRRLRDAQKEADKRIRILQKFRCKQQLLLDKIALKRRQQQEEQEQEQQRREQEEREENMRRIKQTREQVVWQVTKLDIMVVIMGMGVVFFDNLTRIELFRPVCAADASSSLLASLGWWPTQTLRLLQCRVLYGLKIAGVFVAGGAAFFVAIQLSMLTVILPAATAGALYYVRSEWLNMLFRLPFLLVLYGFNSASLYVLNRWGRASTSLRQAAFLYLVFPLVSLALSAIVSVTIACDLPQECLKTGWFNMQQTFGVLGAMIKQAYRL